MRLFVIFMFFIFTRFSFILFQQKPLQESIKEGKVIYYLYVPSVTASDNEFMESDSQLLIMNDDDIASLNSILSTKVIDDFIKKENSADDLFN